MNHIFVCGFNGFQQIQDLDSWLKSHKEAKPEAQGGQLPVDKEAKCKQLHQVPDDDSDEKHTADKLSNSELAVGLRRTGSYSDDVQLERVEITWSRIGISASTGAGLKPDGSAVRTFRSLVCGFSNDRQQMSHPLLCSLSDCELRACNHSGILMQQADQLLLLREGRNQVEPLSMTPESAETDTTADAVTLSSVSGTAENFIASYGISVGKLSSEESPCNAGDASCGSVLRLSCLDSGLSVKHISCGLEHALLLTQHGSVLSWGAGSRGQLGNGLLEKEDMPQVVSALEGLCCVRVAAGGWHSAVVSEFGDLYMWGWNESGQLGLPSPSLQHPRYHQSQYTQQQCSHPRHSQQCHGQQQQEGEEEEVKAASLHLWPVRVDVIDQDCTQTEDASVTSVACGSRHTAVLTDNGQVYTSGWNTYRQLGLTHTDSIDYFSRVHFHGKDVTATQVWCGAWNSLFVVKDTPT